MARGVRTLISTQEEAREDLKQANTLDPKNKAVRSAWSDLRKKFAEQSKPVWRSNLGPHTIDAMLSL